MLNLFQHLYDIEFIIYNKDDLYVYGHGIAALPVPAPRNDNIRTYAFNFLSFLDKLGMTS